jgi:hypothetical protein
MERRRKRHVLKRGASILFLFYLLVIFCVSCKDTNNEIPLLPPTPLDSYHITILGLTTLPRAEVVPPIEGSVPGIAHPGVFLIFRDHDIVLSIGKITINGNEISVEVTIRNNLGAPFPRTWVVIHSPDSGVTLNTLKADGLIDNGVFYYVGGLEAGEEKSVTIHFTCPLVKSLCFRFCSM